MPSQSTASPALLRQPVRESVRPAFVPRCSFVPFGTGIQRPVRFPAGVRACVPPTLRRVFARQGPRSGPLSRINGGSCGSTRIHRSLVAWSCPESASRLGVVSVLAAAVTALVKVRRGRPTSLLHPAARLNRSRARLPWTRASAGPARAALRQVAGRLGPATVHHAEWKLHPERGASVPATGPPRLAVPASGPWRWHSADGSAVMLLS